MRTRTLSRTLAGPAAALAFAVAWVLPALAEMPADVVVPGDPVAKAAFDVLDRHCARCHQDGRLGNRLQPAKNFGNILKLDQIAADPHYVAPGNPDGSRIVQQILNKEMPYDVYYEADLSRPVPSEAEIAALRTWIGSLGQIRTRACADRSFVSPLEMVAAMADDLDRVQRTRAVDTRYLTLTHLHNACASAEEMAVYRQGAVKLLNSLSRVSDVVRLETVDAAETILRFNLKDIGWSPEDWDRVLAVYPYAAIPESRFFDTLTMTTFTPLPYVRGDWFAFAASRPPLYDRLLGLPDDFAALQATLGVNVAANLQRFVAKRAGFLESGVSRNNRLIERHASPTGYFWTSYDFAGNRDRQNLFAFPLGPGDGPHDFDYDGGETIFSLPNGFQGYYLNTASGAKLDKGPTAIVLDPGRRDQSVTNGISCMGCHDQGIRKATDAVRDHVMDNPTYPDPVRDAVEALYPPADEMDTFLAADTARFQNAMRLANLDPALKLNGVEPINALAKRYEDAIDMTLAAAEFGQDGDGFMAAMDITGDPRVIRLGQRLSQGLVPRDTFEEQFVDIVGMVSDLEPMMLTDLIATVDEPMVADVDRPVADRRHFDVALFSDRPVYRVGDLAVFTVATEADCYLTLINVDSAGTATVIFPNRFQEDNFVAAGVDLVVPADDSPFQFRLGDRGTETVIAICSLQDRAVDNIAIDADSVFTDLGDYDTHLSRAITVEQKTLPAGGKQTTPGDIVARTAITVPVE